MTSAAPARKPYRKAPPQHRETRQALPAAPPPPAPQHDINQVNLNTPQQHFSYIQNAAMTQRSQSAGTRHGAAVSPISESELDASSLSSLELCIPPPPLFGSANRPNQATRGRSKVASISPRHTVSPYISGTKEVYTAHGSPARKNSPSRSPRREHHGWSHRSQAAAMPKGILKHSALLGVEHAYDVIRKSKSVELLDNGRGRGRDMSKPSRSLDRTEERTPVSRRSSAPPSPCRNEWNWKMQALEEKVRFSNFIDELTCQVLSPARLSLLGKSQSKEHGSPAPERSRRRSIHRRQQEGDSAVERSRRWDDWVAAMQRPDSWYQPLLDKEAGPAQGDITEGARCKEEGVNKGVKMGLQEAEETQRHKHKPPLSNQCHLSQFKVGQRRQPSSLLPPLHLLPLPLSELSE